MSYELQGDNVANSAGTGAPNAPFGIKTGGLVVGKTLILGGANGFIASATTTKLGFSTVYAGVDAGVFNFDAVNNWVIPLAGVYLMQASVLMVGDNGVNLTNIQKAYILIQKNLAGDSFIGGTTSFGPTWPDNNINCTVAFPVFANGTDKFFINGNAKDNLNTQTAISTAYWSITALGNNP